MSTPNDQEGETVIDDALETETNQSPGQDPSSSDASVGTTSPVGALGAGITINGRYVIERELGRGGIGVVYLARDKQLLAKPVVVKVLLEGAQQNEWVRRKFLQEMEALARLEHSGIVGVLDAGELADGKPFLVMQYVEGVPLRAALRVEGMALERVAHLIRQIGRALSAAHDKGILHRDLKPENIMLQTLDEGEEQIKIIDFGIAKIKDSLVAPETATAATVGTIIYMSPEQLSAKPLSIASDVYALGIIAHEMLTGRRPFNPDSAFQLLEMQRTGVRIRPVDLRPSLSVNAEQVILKALAFNPKDRYSRARAFGDELARALTAEVDTLDASASLPHADPSMSTITLGNAQVAETDRSVAIETAPIASDRKTTPADDQRQDIGTGPAPRSARFNPLLVVFAGLVLLGLIGVGVWFKFGPKSKTQGPDDVQKGQTSAREMSFVLMVLKMRDGKPVEKPYESSGHERFENGWQFWMNITSAQAGYLYIINEGPKPRNGLPSYNVLFPLGGGSALLAPNQRVESPPRQGRGYFFDQEAGTERMWLIWAEKPVLELESIKSVANPVDKGRVTDSTQVKALQDFFNRQTSPKPVIEMDNKRTIVRENGDVLVHLLELEHH